MSYFDKFDAQEAKLENIMEANGLLYQFNTSAYPITLTITPNEAPDEQMALYENKADDASSKDAKLVLSFPVGEIGVRVYGRLIISDALLGKIKNQGKKMRDLWLQANFASVMDDAEHTSSDKNVPDMVGYDEEQLPGDFKEFFEDDDAADDGDSEADE